MIIIAIPKSASTSLMLTLKKHHNIDAKQDFSIRDNEVPENCKQLHKLHSDVRELTNINVEKFSSENQINKQHIYPSSNNVELLLNTKKVILLRSTEDIILAYRRGAIKKVHNLLPGYNVDMSEKDWIEKAKSDGLYSDLEYFQNEWKKKANPSNTLLVSYNDYVKTPKKVINSIEIFYCLPITETKIETIKARYSRGNWVKDNFESYKKKASWYMSKIKSKLTKR